MEENNSDDMIKTVGYNGLVMSFYKPKPGDKRTQCVGIYDGKHHYTTDMEWYLCGNADDVIMRANQRYAKNQCTKVT